MNKSSIQTTESERVVRTNAIPNHLVGAFPNPGNQNRFKVQDKSYRITRMAWSILDFCL